MIHYLVLHVPTTYITTKLRLNNTKFFIIIGNIYVLIIICIIIRSIT